MIKQNFIIPDERPAFMRIVDCIQSNYQINDGYTLQIDSEHLSASIINLKKGGAESMEEEIKVEKKIVRVADEGLADLFDILVQRKANISADKQVAIDKAIEEINARFVEEEQKIDNCINEVSHEEEIEVPVEETSEEVSVENADDTING